MLLTSWCQSLNQLPRAGGILDQDAYLMVGMQMVGNAQAERASMKKGKKKNATDES